MIATAGFGYIKVKFLWGETEKKKGEYNFTDSHNIIKMKPI
jgi:hypothetical protein